MIIKIRKDGASELDGQSETAFVYYDNATEVCHKTKYGHKDGQPVEVQLSFYDKDRNYHAISLQSHAYLMSDSGKTIDTIVGIPSESVRLDSEYPKEKKATS